MMTWASLLAQVDVTPSAAGMPGADLIQQILDWLSQLALWGSLASILIGAGVYGISQNSGSYAGSFRGKQLALGNTTLLASRNSISNTPCPLAHCGPDCNPAPRTRVVVC